MSPTRTPFRILALLLSLLLVLSAGLVAQAEESDDPVVGTWTVITRFDGGTAEAWLTITREGEALAGVWKDNRGETEVEELAFTDGTLTFVRIVDQGPRKLNIAFSATVKDNRLHGAHRLPRQEVPCWGARGKAALKALQAELVAKFKPAADPEVDFEQNSRRAAPVDAFPVLFDPTLTPAAEATEIRDSEPVIGVAIGDEAKAYPISIMGVHELANDTCGGTPIMTSW